MHREQGPAPFLVVGRAGMDIYPEPPGTSIEGAQCFSAHLGGSAANIAVALCRLGARASLLTAVSDDAVGDFCLARLQEFGVGTELVRRSAGGTRTSLAVSESRVVGHQTVIYRNGAADFDLPLEDTAGVALGTFGALVVTGTALARDPSRGTVLALAERARAAGLEVVFDMDYRPYSWASGAEASRMYGRFCALSDVVIGNAEEYAVLAGRERAGPETARALVGAGARVAVYKMGGEGAVTFSTEQEVRTGTFPATPLKPVGAGDAFMGSFLVARARGMPLRESVLRGSAAAAIVVSARGCSSAMPDVEILETFLRSHQPSAATTRHA